MRLVVNGADVEVDDRHAKTPLLWLLRAVLDLLRRLHRPGRRAKHEVVPDRDRARRRQARIGSHEGAFTLSWEG
jgi:hypothetical protein